jgi:tetratricopeptide (TPR) repeat protein
MQRVWGLESKELIMRANHLADSARYFEMAVRLSPNMPYVRNEWAITLLQADELDKARPHLDASLQLDGTYAQTYFYLGEYYRLKKDIAYAGEYYLRAIDFDYTVLSDPSGRLLAGPSTILAQRNFVTRAIAKYRHFNVEFPKSVVPQKALEELGKDENK